MSRELGGWSYSDLWAASGMQHPGTAAVSPAYSAGLPFHSDALPLPYTAPQRSVVAWAYFPPTLLHIMACSFDII